MTVDFDSAGAYTLHTFSTVGTSAFDLSGVNMNQRLGVVHNGIISGSGDLSFAGPGRLTLNAANTHSGVTRVNAGTLALGSSGSIGSSSGVSIANGANFNVSTVTGGFILGSNKTLSSGGIIAGNVTISGTHSPGFSPGIQAINGDLAYVWGLCLGSGASSQHFYDLLQFQRLDKILSFWKIVTQRIRNARDSSLPPDSRQEKMLR